MTKRYVIVGTGPAGLTAADTICALDPAGSLAIVAAEPDRPYSRMVTPYYLAGEIAEEAVYTRPPSYFADRGIATYFGHAVTAVDTGGRLLTMDNGRTLEYDELLIATGSSPSRPPIPGAEGSGVHTMWTLEDARQVLARVQKGSRVVIVGAGFIGLIVLDALHKVGAEITVVEVMAQILPRMMDAAGAEVVESWLTARGVRVLTASRVVEIGGSQDGTKRLGLADGTELVADVVILSTGIRPNTGFLDGSGVTVEQGILVDDHLRTTVPHVYAAGDVAQGPDLCTGEQRVHAIWPTAVDHGRVAARNMAGAETRYRGSLLMNVLETAQLSSASFGRWADDQLEATVAEDGSGRVYRKLLWAEDRLAGAILVGNVYDAGAVKGLIQSGVSLGPWKDRLRENPLDVCRAFLAAQSLVGHQVPWVR
jgi:NAD(P)H-nitrite reductase large subunit